MHGLMNLRKNRFRKQYLAPMQFLKLGTGYNIVLAPHCLSLLTEDEVIKFFARNRQMLSNDGKLVVFEELAPIRATVKAAGHRYLRPLIWYR